MHINARTGLTCNFHKLYYIALSYKFTLLQLHVHILLLTSFLITFFLFCILFKIYGTIHLHKHELGEY